MMDASHTQVLITINIHPTLEEPMIDWLLERESGPGFTSFDIRGHSASHDHLSLAEQVSGRQHRMRFEIALNATAVPEFVEHLEQQFSGADVHYWATPVLAASDLNDTHTDVSG